MVEQDDYRPGSISELFEERHRGDSINTKVSRLFLKPTTNPEPFEVKKKQEVKLLSVKSKTDDVNDETARKGNNDDESKSLKKQKKQTLSRDDDLGQLELKEKMEERNRRSVFVGCLPVSITKKRLKKMFQKYGKIESIRLRSVAPEDPKLPKKAAAVLGKFHPKIHTLNAYIVFATTSAAEHATELNNADVDGIHIRVDFLGSGKQHDHSRSIFVGNLPFDANEEEVRQHFSECGQIESVRLIRDKCSRFGKGFGYVLFAEKDSVLLSLKLDGQKFKGRCLRVQRSTPNARKSENSVKKLDRQKSEVFERTREHKKRKHLDSGEADDGVKKKKKIAVKFKAQTGRLVVAKKDKMKKKLKRRAEKKKKQHLADILLGNRKESQQQR